MHSRTDSGVAFDAQNDLTGHSPTTNDSKQPDCVSKKQAAPHSPEIIQESEPIQNVLETPGESLTGQTDDSDHSNALNTTNGIESSEPQIFAEAQISQQTEVSVSSAATADIHTEIKSESIPPPAILSYAKGRDWPTEIPATWELLVASVSNYPDNVAVASIQQRGEYYDLANTVSDHAAYKANPYVRWSYAEFAKGLVRSIDALQQLGTVEGSAIFTFLESGVEVPLVFWAAAALGCTLIPLSPQILLNESEAKYAIERAFTVCPGANTIVFAQSTELLEKLSNLNVLANPTYVSVNDVESKSTVVSFKTYMESGARHSSSSLSQHKEVAARRKIVLFTSGTTSLPKAVLFDTFKLDRWILKHSAVVQTDHNDSTLINLPNNHAFYLLYSTLYPCRAGAMVIGGSTFSAELFPTIMEIEHLTHLPCPPTLAQAMLQVAEARGLRFPGVKSILLGSAKVTGSALQQIIDGLGVQGGVIMYGGTETGCVTTTGIFAKADSIVRKTDPSIGWVDMGVEIRVCAPNSREPVPLNTEGEIHSGGSITADGYVGETEHESFYTDEDGKKWYVSGDAGMMNDEGLIFIVGRVKDMIIRGGKNISPAAIETILSREPATKGFNIQVVGKLDSIAGEIPIAVSQTAVTTEDVDKIQNLILDCMGPIYLPEEVLTLEQLGLTDFPRSTLDKIAKSKLTKIVRHYFDSRDAPKTNGVHKPDELTEQVQKVWKRTIGHNVDIDRQITDFADSITTMRVRDRLSKEVGVKLTLPEILEAKTIRDQIERIRGRSKESEHQIRVPETEDALNEKDLLYLTHGLTTARTARGYITKEISKFGLSWEDVHTVSPASDFVQTFVQADICNASWSWKFAFALKPGVPMTTLRRGIETMLTNNKILPSFLLWNRKAFGSDLAIHVIPKSNDRLFDAVFKEYGTVANTAEFAKLVNKPYEHEMALISGLLCHFLLFHIEETNQAGAIWVSNHATMDATYMQLVFDDLDKSFGGSIIRPHIPYKIWADSYHSLRTSFEAQMAVNWQVNRLNDLNTHRDSVFPPLPRPHHFQSSQIHIQEVDDNGHHANFHAAGLTNLRQKHPGLSAPTIIKTAWSLMNMHRTGTYTALFSNLQADRKRFPFVPKILEALSPAHTFEASDVAGITLQDVINIIPLEPEETVLDLLYRVTDDQAELNEYAAAPLKSIMREIGPLDSEIMLDVFRSQIFNWTPGLGAFKAVNPHENYEIYGTFIRPSLRLVINVDVSGPEDETVYFEIKSPLYDRDGLRGLAEDFEDLVHFVCNETNWNIKSTEFKNSLRKKSLMNGGSNEQNGH